MSLLEALKPGVPRRALFFVASFVWGIAGLILCIRGWIVMAQGSSTVLPLADGAAGALFYYFMFARIPAKHIQRISAIPHQLPCAFSFLDWRGYAIMALMISLGMTLRMSGIVPPRILGSVYIVMGVALLLSSARFVATGMKRREA